MKCLKHLAVTAILTTAVVTPPAWAAADDATGFDIAAKLSTLGYGGEIGYRFNDYLAVRVGLNGGNYTYKDNTNPNNHFTVNLGTAPVILDWHVFGGTFRLSAGYVNNQTKATAIETGQVDVGNNTYNTTMTGTVNWGTSASYVGLGWASLPSTKGGFGFSFDLGAMHQGSPNVTVTAPGVPQSDIDAQVATYKSDMELPWWPVLSFGIGYTF